MPQPDPKATPPPPIRSPAEPARIERLGRAWSTFDPYHASLVVTWPRFLLGVVLFYLAFNAFFALLYLARPGCVVNARPGDYGDAFFFSVQTMMTIGYGVMAPGTTYAHVLVAIESLTGLLGVAVVTGLVFARFSRPRAKVLFSGYALITRRDGRDALLLRLANGRRSHIVEAQVHVVLARNEVTKEGENVRRFYDLALVRDRNTSFALSWTIIHYIDETSLLRGVTEETLRAWGAELVVSVMGVDETTMQTVHARWSYGANRIRFGGRFADILVVFPDGRRALDYGKFHEIVPNEPAAGMEKERPA